MASDINVLTGRMMKSTEKLARYDSNLKFLTSCADKKLVPKGMRPTFGRAALPNSDFLTQTVNDVLRTASLQILHSCRDTYKHLVKSENDKLCVLLYDIQQSTDFNTFESIYKKRKNFETSFRQSLHNKKRKKMQRLTEEENAPTVPHLQRKNRRFKRHHHPDPTDKALALDDRTVVNLSSTVLTQEQKDVLSKGSKFCPTPRTLDHDRLSRDVREGCRRLRLSELHYHPDREDTSPPPFYKPTGYEPPSARDMGLDTYIHLLITNSDCFKDNNKKWDNLSPSNRTAIKDLKCMVSDRTIRISSADKGGAIVVQDTTDYIKEAERQLSDTTFYSKIDTDPTVNIAKCSNKIVNELHDNGYIDDHTHRWAFTDPRDVRTHIYHHLPKIHKSLTDPPGRPIISGINGPTEKLSKLIDYWLQNYVSVLPSYIKDTTHMLQTIQDWNLKNGRIEGMTLVTIDVVSLYTNIPHSDMICALTHFLNKQHNEHTPPTQVVVTATEHVLLNNVFTFEDQLYKQIHGTAMGTPMAPSLANLFMGWLEDKIMSSSPIKFPTDNWKRFLDDIFLLWPGTETELQTFTQFLNTVHPTIKFTVQSSQTQLPFLDILIKIKDGMLQTDLYTKPTDAHNYLHYRSAHPSHVKNNIPYSQFLRLRRLCSQEEDFVARCTDMTNHLKCRGYPSNIISKALEQVHKISRSQSLQYQQKTQTQRVPFVVTHNPHNPPLKKWFRDFLPYLHSNPRLQKAIPEPPILGERNSHSLRDMLMPSVLPEPNHGQEDPGCFSCKKSRCIICTKHLVQTPTFSSASTSQTFTIRHKMTCETSNLIYLLFCSKCQKSQYIGETKCSLKQRFYQHRSNINKNAGTLVTLHFNQNDHSLEDMRCIAIEKVFSDVHSRRLAREAFWIKKLQTLSPHGLNTMIV